MYIHPVALPDNFAGEVNEHLPHRDSIRYTEHVHTHAKYGDPIHSLGSTLIFVWSDLNEMSVVIMVLK